MERIDTDCCIAGGGPAGMMLGYLLARAGVRTVVLEKHDDFLRDFRGDTVHPSTLRILDDCGLLDAFLERPHQKLRRVGAAFGEQTLTIADFSGLPERYAFIAFMPQWEFLDFIADEARKLPAFTLRMRVAATGLMEEGGAVVGVKAQGSEGDIEVRAALTVGADGRHSTLRDAAALPVEHVGAPIDVLWFRVGRDPGDGEAPLGRVVPGRFIVTLDRGDYWQCAFVIDKGGADRTRARGIEAFRAEVAAAVPVLAPHVGDIASFDDVKLLVVAVDRLTRWSRSGLLCIGDAAHAMSPVGGVGINLAIQDAVAAANALAAPLRAGTVDADALDAVRRRRLWPTRVTQAMQVQIQNNVLVPALSAAPGGEVHAPWPMQLVSHVPLLQRSVARLLGMGVRPERVESGVAA